MPNQHSESFLNDKILDHFQNPRNIGELENPDGYAVIGDPKCGDYIKVWLRIKDETIIDFKYKVFGCWGAIATTSVVSELATDKTLKTASQISDDDVIRELNGIPQNKQHCSLLGVRGLRTAIVDFLVKDNHKKYMARLQHYKDRGYDMLQAREKIVDFIDHLPVDAMILDVGTGKGHLALSIARRGRSCYSVDISDTELYYAQLNAIYAQLDDQIQFEKQDARDLKFDNNLFDAVLTANFLHHLEQPEPVLQELLRVCKSGGQIVISDLNKRGQAFIAECHRDEGRDHTVLGWTLEKVTDWFQQRGHEIRKIETDYETIMNIRLHNSEEK